MTRLEPRNAIILGLLLVSAALAAPGVTHAQASTARRVLLLAPGVEEADGQRRLVASALAEAGVNVVGVGDVKLDPALAACRTTKCAVQAARGCDASAAVLAQIVAGADGRPAMFTLRLVAKDGRISDARVPLGEVAVTTAAKQAFVLAERALSLGGDALLRVKSTPVGATVLVDGGVVGQAPSEHRVKAGSHQVELQLAGFDHVQRNLEAESGRLRLVDVVLARSRLDGSAQGRAPGGTPRTSSLNYVAGAALLAAAAPALFSSLVTLASDGSCAVELDARQRCTARVHFGALSTVLLAVGALSAGFGGYLLVARPWTVDGEISPTATSVRWTGRF